MVLTDTNGKPIEERTPSSVGYDIFLEQNKQDGLKIEHEINSLYRYVDDQTGKERIRFFETLSGVDGNGKTRLTCSIGRNLHEPQTIPEHQEVEHRKELKLRKDDKESSDFDFTPANLKKLKALCGGKTNYYIETGPRARSTIKAEQFFEGKRTDIISNFNAVKKDFADLIKQMMKQS